jgi:hypothetical protein
VVQLQILTGKLAGSDVAVRQFPFSVGRGAKDHLQLSDEGVWDSHFHVNYTAHEGFSASRRPDATLLVNGVAIDTAKLKNGDMLSAGGTQIRFWLAPTRQKTMQVREILTWSALAALFALQMALIYRLL